MDERQETIEYLTGPVVGISPEEAELIMADDDLFLTYPESRYGYEPEEAAKIWDEAQDKLVHLLEAQIAGDIFGNVGISLLLDDAVQRATELRRRSKARAKEASAE